MSLSKGLADEQSPIDESEHGLVNRQLPERRRRRKKISEGPAAQKTGYSIFLKNRYRELKADNPHIRYFEIVEALGAEWRNLPMEQKQPYLKAGEQDKERYIQELTAYRLAEAYKLEKQALKEKNDEYEKKLKEKNDEYEEKGFMKFLCDRSPIFEAQNPMLGRLEVMSVLSAAWKAMSSMQKQKYVIAAVQDKDIQDLHAYIKSCKNINNECQHTGDEPESDDPRYDTSINIEQALVNNNYGYGRFLKDSHKKFRANKFWEQNKALSAAWTTLPCDQKKQYLIAAREDKERYSQNLAAYKQSESYKLLSEQEASTSINYEYEQPGYIKFSKERMEKLKTEDTNVPFHVINNALVAEWRTLPIEQKQQYSIAAEEDRERYLQGAAMKNDEFSETRQEPGCSGYGFPIFTEKFLDQNKGLWPPILTKTTIIKGAMTKFISFVRENPKHPEVNSIRNIIIQLEDFLR